MFYNPEDIKYFKPVELKTRLGLRGNILEPVGTHGIMKAVFNNYLKPHDTIILELYKRVFPIAKYWIYIYFYINESNRIFSSR